MLFLENEVQINKNNYATMLFMSKQVSLPKISSILQKIKISPKSYICPFCMKAFNYGVFFKGAALAGFEKYLNSTLPVGQVTLKFCLPRALPHLPKFSNSLIIHDPKMEVKLQGWRV